MEAHWSRIEDAQTVVAEPVRCPRCGKEASDRNTEWRSGFPTHECESCENTLIAGLEAAGQTVSPDERIDIRSFLTFSAHPHNRFYTLQEVREILGLSKEDQSQAFDGIRTLTGEKW